MFTKTVIRQCEKICRLTFEISKLREDNKILKVVVENKDLKNKRLRRLLEIVESDLLKIQDIDYVTTLHDEKERRMHRNIIINKLNSNINKELSNTY